MEDSSSNTNNSPDKKSTSGPMIETPERITPPQSATKSQVGGSALQESAQENRESEGAGEEKTLSQFLKEAENEEKLQKQLLENSKFPS
jgi:hypothetical protein